MKFPDYSNSWELQEQATNYSPAWQAYWYSPPPTTSATSTFTNSILAIGNSTIQPVGKVKESAFKEPSNSEFHKLLDNFSNLLKKFDDLK